MREQLLEEATNLYALELEERNKELASRVEYLSAENSKVGTEAYRYKTAYEMLVKEIAK